MNSIEKQDFSKLQKERPVFSCCQLYWEYLQPTVMTGLIPLFQRTTKLFWLHWHYGSWYISLIMSDHAWVMMWEQSLSDKEHWVSSYCIKIAYHCKAMQTFQRRATVRIGYIRKRDFFLLSLRSSFRDSTSSPCKVKYTPIIMTVSPQDERTVRGKKKSQLMDFLWRIHNTHVFIYSPASHTLWPQKPGRITHTDSVHCSQVLKRFTGSCQHVWTYWSQSVVLCLVTIMVQLQHIQQGSKIREHIENLGIFFVSFKIRDTQKVLEYFNKESKMFNMLNI